MEKFAESAPLTVESAPSETMHGATTSGETAQGQRSADSAQTEVPARRMLFRHPVHRVLGGICGGIADYFGWDPALVRILWVVVTLATAVGGGILAYVALWMLLPVGTAEGGQQRPAALELNERNLSRAAVLLMSLGVLWLLANVGILPWMWDAFWGVMGIFFWPALLIGAGYLLLRYTGKELNFNWRGTGDRVKHSVNGHMPSKEDVKQSMRNARQRFPLKRSRSDRIFMGVCGGIGQRLGVDANLVRLVWAAFSVGSIGMGVLVYVLLGLFLPEEQVTDLSVYDEMQDIQVIDGSTTRV